MRKLGYVLILTLLIPYLKPAAPQMSGPGCTASRLTDDEARILLYVTPAAVSARRAGTDVDIWESGPAKEYPADEFFVAALQTQEPTADSLFGNGILGYFAVDKRTGDVEFLGDFTPVSGKELMRVQNWMRHSHCIQLQHTSSSRSR